MHLDIMDLSAVELPQILFFYFIHGYEKVVISDTYSDIGISSTPYSVERFVIDS